MGFYLYRYLIEIFGTLFNITYMHRGFLERLFSTTGDWCFLGVFPRLGVHFIEIDFNLL